MKTKTINLYSFDELSPEAQKKAIENIISYWQEHDADNYNYSTSFVEEHLSNSNYTFEIDGTLNNG